MKSYLHICSLNCQGLRIKEKRLRLKTWIINQKCDILFIQESHFIESDQENLRCEINGKFFHSFGSTQSKGVSIWIRKDLEYKVINSLSDKDGRIIMINIEIEDKIYTLVNIYAPNSPKARNSFFKNTKKNLLKTIPLAF